MVTYEIKKSTPVHPFQRHWQFCVGSGHAALALRAGLCGAVEDRSHEDSGDGAGAFPRNFLRRYAHDARAGGCVPHSHGDRCRGDQFPPVRRGL